MRCLCPPYFGLILSVEVEYILFSIAFDLLSVFSYFKFAPVYVQVILY
jgi:hypothetical protein